MAKMRYQFNCVHPPDDVEFLSEMIDTALEISRKAFKLHVEPQDRVGLETDLGYFQHYKQGMTMGADLYVRYYRSRYRDQKCYFVTQSACEYVFFNKEE